MKKVLDLYHCLTKNHFSVTLDETERSLVPRDETMRVLMSRYQQVSGRLSTKMNNAASASQLAINIIFIVVVVIIINNSSNNNDKNNNKCEDNNDKDGRLAVDKDVWQTSS